MFPESLSIKDESFVTDIVKEDYRTSSVFRRYNIDYCCGGRLSLQTVCEIRGLSVESLKQELVLVKRTIPVSSSTDFDKWNVDFLTDYISHVHHNYLLQCLPDVVDTISRFTESHKSKFAFLPELMQVVLYLRDNLLAHIDQEEEIIFPYIKQISRAYQNKEPYASLLVRTLRKPIENLVNHEHREVGRYLHLIRKLTTNYTIQPGACITHRVSFYKLKELDADLMQHIHLECNILFPKAVAMEKELLNTD
jgi:regulator of cell morphogenesis and NO signaling